MNWATSRAGRRGQGRSGSRVLGQGFLVGLSAGWARADVTGVGCRTSYESHWFPAVRTRYLLGHFRSHGAPFIGPNGPSASLSSLVWVWRVSAVLRLGAALAWLALTAPGPPVSLLEPLAAALYPAAKTSWSYR